MAKVSDNIAAATAALDSIDESALSSPYNEAPINALVAAVRALIVELGGP